MADMAAKGRAGRAKLTPDEVREIRRIYVRNSKTHGIPSLARIYGLHIAAIHRIIHRKWYRWVI